MSEVNSWLDELWELFSSDIWLGQMLPEKFWHLIAPIALLIVGVVVETRYVSRVSMFSNAAALHAFFVGEPGLPLLLKAYINVAAILGPLALIAYVERRPLKKEMYMAFGGFGSLVSGFLMVWWLSQ